MNLTEELMQAFIDHEEHTGNKPSKLRIHENLWGQLKREFEALSAVVEGGDENPLQFRGASVTLVKVSEDPMGLLRYSIQ